MKLFHSMLATIAVSLTVPALADPDPSAVQNAKDAFFADAGSENLNGKESWTLNSVTTQSFVITQTHRPALRQGVGGQEPNSRLFFENTFDGDWSALTSVKAVLIGTPAAGTSCSLQFSFAPTGVTIHGISEGPAGEASSADAANILVVSFLSTRLLERFVTRVTPLLQSVAPNAKIDMTAVNPPRRLIGKP